MSRIGRPPNSPESLWRYVEVRGANECWPWIAARSKKGYGQVTINYRTSAAHRVAYAVATGTDPGDLCVLHRCDNPPCCNPSHLFLGTRGDNNRDASAKRRNAHGERHRSAKLTAADVRAIRERSGAGEQGIDLAVAFGVTPQAISYVVRRETWRHV